MSYAAVFAVAVAAGILLRVLTAPTPRRPPAANRVHIVTGAPLAARLLARRRRYLQMLTDGHLVPVGAVVPDPGNPPWTLRLAVDVHGAITIRGGTVLLATQPTTANAGPTLVAIPVPPGVTDPVAAAAWTYGDVVTPALYSTLTRRT